MSTGVRTVGAFSRLIRTPSRCNADVITKEMTKVEEAERPGESDADREVVGTSTEGAGPDAPTWARPYKSARTRAVMATIALSLILANIVLFVWITLNYNAVVGLLGDEKTLESWSTLLSLTLLSGGVLSFLLWFARSYRNLPALGAHELKYSPRSAVGWWFVPFASMVLPLLVAIELSRASDPSIRPNGRSERRQAPFPTLLLTWWVAFMAATILAGLPISSQEVLWFAVLAGLEILAAGLAIAVIWTVQLREDAGLQPSQDATQPLTPQKRTSRVGLVLGLTSAGGCLGLIALAVLLVALFFRNATENCPPKDFPVYPGASQTDFNYVMSGATSSCRVGWESSATPTEVSDFYGGRLDTSAWQLLGQDPGDGLWYFQRRTDASTVGRMGFSNKGTGTRIEAEILTGQSPRPSATP